MPEVAADDTLVTARQAAEILGVSLRTVERMRAEGVLRPIYLPTPRGRRELRRFRLADVEARKTPTGAVSLPGSGGAPHTQQAEHA